MNIEDPPEELLAATITIETNALNKFLEKIATQLNRHSKLITGVVDEVRAVKASVEAVRDEIKEEVSHVKRTVAAHETQLRIAQQNIDVAVSNTQFNTAIAKMKETMSVMQEKVVQVENNSGDKLQESMDTFVSEYIDKWYAEIGLRDAYTRHARTLEQVQFEMASHKKEIVSTVEEKVSGKTTKMEDQVQRELEVMRNEVFRFRKALADESEKLDEKIKENEKTGDSRFDTLSTTCTQNIDGLEKRVAMMYEILSLSEKDMSAALQVNAENEKRRRIKSNVAPLPSGTGNSNSGQDDEDLDMKTSLVMQSPVFLAFRHQLFRDIANRVSASRTAQASDIDIEILDIRNELKAKTTVPRVVELIRQYADLDTPNRVGQIVKKIQEIELDKVSHAHFNDALKAKADSHILELKADRSYLTEVEHQSDDHFNSLQSQFQVIADERNEFKDILRDVLYMHKRAQVNDEALSLERGGGDFHLLYPQQMPQGGEGSPSAPPYSLQQPSSGHGEQQGHTIMTTNNNSTSMMTNAAAADRHGIKFPTLKGSAAGEGSANMEYMSTMQGVDRRGTEDQVKRAEAKRKMEEFESSVTPVGNTPSSSRAETPREGSRTPNTKKVASVRPLTDHRNRERETAQLVAMSSPVEMKSKISAPPVSSIEPKHNKKFLSQKDVVPMTASQEAYAKVVAETALRKEVEHQPVPPYIRDTKPRQVPKVFED